MKTCWRIGVPLLVLSVLVSHHVLAQTQGNLLSGVKKAAVLVNTLFDTEECGVERDDIKAAFEKPFSDSEIELAASGIDIAIKLTVMSSMPRSADGKPLACVTIIDVEAWAQTGYRKLKFNKASTITKAVVYNKSMKVVSSVKDHPANARRIAGELAAKFIKDHTMDN